MDSILIRSGRQETYRRSPQAHPVHFVPGGHGSNTLAIGFRLLPHEAVVSADSGHIVGDEVGAIEAAATKLLPCLRKAESSTPRC